MYAIRSYYGLETTVVYRKDLPLKRLGEDFAEQILMELETNKVAFMGDTSLEGFEPSDTGGIIVHTSGVITSYSIHYTKLYEIDIDRSLLWPALGHCKRIWGMPGATALPE